MIDTLVIAPNWVGDTVMAWPVLDALAASERRLTVLAKAHLHPLLALHSSRPSLLARRGDDETVEALRAAACQEAVLLPNSFRAAWLPWRAGIPYRWGYRGQLRTLLLRPGVGRRRGARRRPQVEDYGELLSGMGVAPPRSWTPRIELPPELAGFAAERLDRAQLPAGGVRVGLFPGAEFGPSKRWPWRRFAELAQALRRELPELRLIVVSGPKEVWTAVRIHEVSGKLHPVIGPELDLAQLAAVLSRLDLLITNDSGPMHLAAAVGVPCLALFGPTDPARTSPAGPGHRVLHGGRWCSPCFRRRCPLLHHRCLRDFEVEQVCAEAVAMIGR